MHPLDGARLKFSRACGHLDALNQAVQGFNSTDTCALVPELNEQTGEVVVRVKILKSPPIEWAIIIGEIAHNLRSCLDLMAWQLALSQVSIPYDKTEFPIFTDSTLYKRNGLRSIRDLSTRQKAFIEGLQPYHAGEDAQTHPLWLLHELNNTDKHRLLPISNLAVLYGPDPEGKIRIFAPNGERLEIQFMLHPQLGEPMEDNAKLFTFKILDVVSPTKQVNVYADVTGSILFGNGIKANSGRRVDKTLESIFRQVDTILSYCAKQFF